MITFIAHLRVRPENAAAFEALMAEVAAMTRAHEPGVVHYDFAKSADEPDTYVVVEVYRDAAVHAGHMASPWVTQSLPRSAALIEGRPHIRQYVNGGSEPVRRTVASD
ncbi:MAG: antibiotic biosynthesis monooxygenase [Novosphingobium sp.]|jgi:quinol monooxygenase YgiN|nr:antibiotic biosynthesis monooxygenase [Novosphingobium sp.]